MVALKSILPLLAALLLSTTGIHKAPESSFSPGPSTEPGPYGKIVWYTLVTPNLQESAAFYKAIFNWEIEVEEGSGQKVALVRYGGKPIASLVELSGADAAIWIALVSTRSVRDISNKFASNGGRALLKPFNIRGTGKQVVLEGPLGEKIGFIENPAHPVSQLTNGDQEWIWTELWSTDTQRSLEFYEKVFEAGISRNEKSDKPYWFLRKNGENVAGIIPNPAKDMRSQWVPYVNVQDIPGFFEGLGKTKAHILLGPDSGYRNGSIVVFEDPHDALLCVQRLN